MVTKRIVMMRFDEHGSIIFYMHKENSIVGVASLITYVVHPFIFPCATYKVPCNGISNRTRGCTIVVLHSYVTTYFITRKFFPPSAENFLALSISFMISGLKFLGANV